MLNNPVKLLIAVILLIFLSSSNAFPVEKQFQPIGSFDGLGITAERAAAGFRVVGVFKGSPAGNRIKPGDIITKVNGISTRKKRADWFYKQIRKPAGSPVRLEIVRMGSWMDFKFKTGKIVLTKKTAPVSGVPVLNISRSDDDFILTSPSAKKKFSKGDTFFVFKGNKHTGYAQFAEASENKVKLKPLNLKEPVNPQKLSQYQLYYFASFSGLRRTVSGKSVKRSNSSNSPGKPHIRIEKVELFIKYSRLRAKVHFANVGNGTADNVVCTCYFVTRQGRSMGQSSLQLKKMPPGSRKIGFFPSGITVNVYKNYVEFTDDSKKAIIYNGPTRSYPVLYKVECNFKFE